MVNYCCVKPCTNTSRKVRMHKFPGEKERFQQWITLTGRDDLRTKPIATVRSGYRVCDEHFCSSHRIPFAKERKMRTDLKANSFPCLKIPNVTGHLCENLLDDNSESIEMEEVVVNMGDFSESEDLLQPDSQQNTSGMRTNPHNSANYQYDESISPGMIEMEIVELNCVEFGQGEGTVQNTSGTPTNFGNYQYDESRMIETEIVEPDSVEFVQGEGHSAPRS